MKEIFKEDFIYHESGEDGLTKINENFKKLNEEKLTENYVENKINEKNFAKKDSEENFQCGTPFFKTTDLILGRGADGSTIEGRRNGRALVAGNDGLIVNYAGDFGKTRIEGEGIYTCPIYVSNNNGSASIGFRNINTEKEFSVGTNQDGAFFIRSNNEQKNYIRAKDSWFEFNVQVTTTQTTPLWDHSLVTKGYVHSLLGPNVGMQKVFDSGDLGEANNGNLTELNLPFNISETDFNSGKYLFYYVVRELSDLKLYGTFDRNGVRWGNINGYSATVGIINNGNTIQFKNSYARINRRLLIFKLF